MFAHICTYVSDDVPVAKVISNEFGHKPVRGNLIWRNGETEIDNTLYFADMYQFAATLNIIKPSSVKDCRADLSPTDYQLHQCPACGDYYWSDEHAGCTACLSLHTEREPRNQAEADAARADELSSEAQNNG